MLINYIIYVDGEPYTFEEKIGPNLNGEDVWKYIGFEEPTIYVPYNFDNYIDVTVSVQGSKAIGFYNNDIETFGVQSVYFYGDNPTFSDIVTYDVATGETNVNEGTGSGVKSMENTEMISKEFYDLAGRKINNPDKGIFIMKTVYSDGSVKVKKIAF